MLKRDFAKVSATDVGATYTTADYQSTFNVNAILADILAKDPPSTIPYDEGVDRTILTTPEIMLKDPIIFRQVIEKTVLEARNPLTKYFPTALMKGEKWSSVIHDFDPQMAELSVLNTVPREVSSQVEHMEGHTRFRQQAYIFDASVLKMGQRAWLFSLLMDTLLSNLQATLMESLAVSIFTNNSPYAVPERRHAADGLMGNTVEYALQQRALRFGRLTKKEHGILTEYNDADAIMRQAGSNFFPSAIFTTQETRTWLSTMDRSRLVFFTEGPDAEANRENTISYIKAKGRRVDILTMGMIDSALNTTKGKEAFLIEVALGGFSKFKNVAEGMLPEEYMTDHSSIEIADWATNGYKRWTLLDCYRRSVWFIGLKDEFPSHAEWARWQDQTHLRVGGLDEGMLAEVARMLKKNNKIDYNTKTDYTGSEWMVDTFLKYNPDASVTDSMTKEEKEKATEQDMWYPIKIIGQIDSRFLPDKHLEIMARCLEMFKNRTGMTREQIDNDVFGFDRAGLVFDIGGGGGTGIITKPGDRFFYKDIEYTYEGAEEGAPIFSTIPREQKRTLVYVETDYEHKFAPKDKAVNIYKNWFEQEIGPMYFMQDMAVRSSESAIGKAIVEELREILAQGKTDEEKKQLEDALREANANTKLVFFGEDRRITFKLTVPTYTTVNMATGESQFINNQLPIYTELANYIKAGSSSPSAPSKYTNRYDVYAKNSKGKKDPKDVLQEYFNTFNVTRDLKERGKTLENLPKDVLENVIAILSFPVTLETLEFLARADVPFPILGMIFDDSQLQQMESIAFLANREIGKQLLGEEELMKCVNYYPVIDQYKIEGGIREGAAVLIREGIYTSDHVIGRATIGGNGDAFITETADGGVSRLLNRKEWEKIVIPRVGNGRRQGTYSKYFVPMPLVDHNANAAYMSSTGFYNERDFDTHLNVAESPSFKQRTKPMFVGQTVLNYVFGIHNIHRNARPPTGDTSTASRRALAKFNNIICATSTRRWSSMAKSTVTDKSEHMWGPQGQNVRQYVSSEIALNDGMTQDDMYYENDTGGSYAF